MASRRKHYTIKATIEKGEITEHERILADKAMDIFLDKIIEIIMEKENNNSNKE